MKSISTLRRKAKAIDLRIEKGFVHCLAYDGIVFRNMYGEREVGYSLIDLTTGYYVWPSYDNEFDHLFSLQDVEKNISDEYQERGLKF